MSPHLTHFSFTTKHSTHNYFPKKMSNAHLVTIDREWVNNTQVIQYNFLFSENLGVGG